MKVGPTTSIGRCGDVGAGLSSPWPEAVFVDGDVRSYPFYATNWHCGRSLLDWRIGPNLVRLGVKGLHCALDPEACGKIRKVGLRFTPDRPCECG